MMKDLPLPSTAQTYLRITGRDPLNAGRRHRDSQEGEQGREVFMRCVNAAGHKNGDQHPSLRINVSKDVWCCDVCGQGGRSLALVMLAGVATDKRAALSWLMQGMRDDIVPTIKKPTLSGLSQFNKVASSRPDQSGIVYQYQDETGKVLHEVVRKEPKSFYQRRPDGNGGYIYNLDGVPRLLYRLPQILRDIQSGRTIVVDEGEKDADRAASLGLCATTNSGGTSFVWTDEFIQPFKGAAAIVVVCDSDETGRKEGRQHAGLLATICDDVKFVDLFPDRNDGSDLSDFFDEGNSLERFKELCRTAKRFEIKSAVSDSDQRNDFKLAADILDEADENREDDLVEGGLLPAGGSAMIVAKPKVGKTTLAYTLALSVARGEPFLGRQTRQGCVLYVALEEKRPKLKATLRKMDITPGDQIHFHIGQTPEGAMAWLLQNAKRYKPVLIVIDTLQRFARLRDVNDYALVTNATQPLLAIAEATGASILWLHHANKGGGIDGDEVLGSTALFGSVDTLITLRRSGTRRTLVTQQRYGDSLEEIILEMDPTTGLVHATGTRQEADLDVAEQLILAHLEDRGEFTEAGAIRDAVEGRKAVIIAALRRLLDRGKITRTGGGKKGDPYLYGLPGTPAVEAQENAGIAVPAYIREPENQNSETALKARQIDLYSVPEVSVVSQQPGNSILEGNDTAEILKTGTDESGDLRRTIDKAATKYWADIADSSPELQSGDPTPADDRPEDSADARPPFSGDEDDEPEDDESEL